MLRVQIRDASNSLIIRIEGRFGGGDAECVQTTVARLNTTLDLVVDITDVTFVDPSGEAVLGLLKRLGAVFVADNSYSLHICDRLRLPLSIDGRPDRRRRKLGPGTFDRPESQAEVDNSNVISNQ